MTGMTDTNDSENVRPLPEEGEDPAARIAALEEEVRTAKDQALRALAEAENTRRRALKEREDVRKYAVADFARDLLDFADNFRRAIDSIPAGLAGGDERVKSVVAGIEAMEREILSRFEKHGIRKIEPLGEPFNPNFHEVMFEAPGTGKPAGAVIQVVESGYMLHDRLLRPARVGVAKDDGAPAAGHVDTQA